MRPNLVRKRKLFPLGPTVATGRDLAASLIGISAQKIEDGRPQFIGICLQVIKEINSKPVWMNITFPSRDDRTGV